MPQPGETSDKPDQRLRNGLGMVVLGVVAFWLFVIEPADRIAAGDVKNESIAGPGSIVWGIVCVAIFLAGVWTLVSWLRDRGRSSGR